MSRLTFALIFPVLTIALGLLMAADLVASGFQGEGWRFAPDAAARWSAGGEWMIVQALFFVPYILLVYGLFAVLRNRQKILRKSSHLPQIIAVLALIPFVCFTFSQFGFCADLRSWFGLYGAGGKSFTMAKTGLTSWHCQLCWSHSFMPILSTLLKSPPNNPLVPTLRPIHNSCSLRWRTTKCRHLREKGGRQP